MDNPDTPKVRRPLPTPGAAPSQRPNTPVYGTAPRPISPSSFYGPSSATKPAPPLPSRPKNHGSTLTAYVAPPSDLPAYGSPSSNPPGFREPELVQEDSHTDDEQIPELIPNNYEWANQSASYDWHSSGAGGWHGVAQWNQPGNWEGGTNNAKSGFDSLDYLNTHHEVDVPIDGRNTHEELNWWNPEERAKSSRPGPGMLAPMLAEELHDPHHSLFSVNISNFPGSSSSLTPQPTTSRLHPTDQSDAARSAFSGSPSLFDPPSAPLYPSADELRAAIPHPNAYYCPKENGWVILSWKSSTMPPPLALSFRPNPYPIPDHAKRKRTASCIGDAEQPFGPSNKTHHFHRYEKAVDGLKLTPPFREDAWQMSGSMKQKRRARTVINDVDKLRTDQTDETNSNEGEPEGRLLDLYICCQCSFYCVVSGTIPGVISRKYLDEFVREKRNNPPVGKTGEIAVAIGLETLLIAVENKIFKGNNRLIKISSAGFQSKLGWNPNIKRIFEFLRFAEHGTGNDATLMSPTTDPNDPTGNYNRSLLLRGWVELSAWLADFKRVNSTAFKDYTGGRTYIQIDSAREMYQSAIGAHPDQIARGELQETALAAVRPLGGAWRGLGLTPTTFSADLLAFAYLAQCRCDPAGTPRYFTYFSDIVSVLQSCGSCPNQLQELMAMEQSRDRFTFGDIEAAAQNLGFGAEGFLRVEYDEDIEDEFVENAWKEAIKRSWRDPAGGTELHRTANEALRILSEARGSARLRRAWETGKNKYMNPDRAYDTLEIPKDVDDYMLITVFNMRLEEATVQMDKMREALAVIAEVRDSDRLRQFLTTGQDPGDIVVPTRPDFPRGLNQLGNTCYLNSLLQYFYTIKDLRAAVLPMSKLDLKSMEEDKLSDEDINRHRVGGRRVTRREIIRSKKFISQLADLFFNMEYCETPAVTPSIELAKLALVTSRDEEEEDEAEKGGSDSSNDTDATLVDDGPSRIPVLEQSPLRSSGSVLGKRPREVDRQKSAMDVDSDGYIIVSSPQRPESPQMMDQDSSQALTQTNEGDEDIRMQGTPSPEKPSPSPPRKRAQTSDSGMMFGKQHDVAECMDNCMFQIETALLKFDSMNEGQTDKSSVVKRLFYGKIRQRLTGANPSSRASIHEKEDLFSHLPVNVTNHGVDIYDGLSGYFDDVVDYEGGEARMEVSLVDLPPLLQIQLQRVQFNRETLQPYKSQAYVKFGETIYLDRFMDSVDPRKKSRSRLIQRELSACRERTQLLLEGKNGSFISSLQHTASYLGDLKEQSMPGIEDYLIGQLQEEQGQIQTEIDELRVKAEKLKDELETLWRGACEFPYELTSVFIHRGSSPSFGHYFFYSRHLPDAPDSWFKYNDSDVSVVSKDEVLQDTTGSTANPYLLVFARKGSQVVETVNRFDTSLLLETA